jgi:hypothetical protein
MRFPGKPASGLPLRCAALALVAALPLLAGCGTQGDFGEVDRILARDDIHDWVGRDPDLDTKSISLSGFALTDDERLLRDLAFPLLEPSYERQTAKAVLREYGHLRTPALDQDRTTYYNHLVKNADRSSSTRYATLADDIRNDMTRLPGFFEVAGRVIDIDGKREKSMAYVALGTIERTNAINRMKENARIIAMVRTSLGHRVASYRYALGHMVVSVPSQQAIEAERLLNQLQAGVGSYGDKVAPTWSREPSLAFSN